MKVFSVVGNRPQFVKAAPTSVALRERGIEEIVLHTGQHYDRELSQVFFEELGLEEPRYALDLRTADPAEMQAAHRRPAARAGAGLGARLRRHQLDAGRRTGRRRRGRSHRPRRGRAAQRRPLDARGAQPDRGRPHRAAALHPGRALARPARRGGRARSRRGRRRRDGRRDAAVRADRAQAGRPVRRRAVRRADDPPGGEHRARPAAAAGREPGRDRPNVRLPRPPADAQGAGRARDRAGAGDSADRPGRLPRDARPRRRCARCRHRLGRTAEGGLLAPRALRDATALDGVGRHGVGRGEHPGRPRRRGASERRARAGLVPRRTRPQLYGDGRAAAAIADALYTLRPA